MIGVIGVMQQASWKNIFKHKSDGYITICQVIETKLINLLKKIIASKRTMHYNPAN